MKNTLCLFTLLAITTTGCTTTAKNDSEPDSNIHIDAGKAIAPVNDKVFGQFIKGADNYGIFSIPKPDLAVLHESDGLWNPETKSPYPTPLKILKSYRPGALRYPDGLGVHGHDWKKTIGPLEERGDWKFGLNEFMQVQIATGAEVIFVVSEYIGTPQDAADLVEYLNMPATEEYPWAMRRASDGHPEPYGVTYFEIGNESWVDWRKTGKPQVRPPEGVGKYASKIAAAMKAVDPNIQCGIPFYRENLSWAEGVLTNISNDIDFAVIHTYPVKYGGRDMNGEKEAQILEAMMAGGYSTAWELEEYQDIITRYAGRSLPLAITEYNMGPTQQQPDLERPYRYTLASAIGAGDYLGRLLAPEKQVITAIYWSWLNGFFEAVHTYAGHPWHSLEKLDQPLYRPTHYMFQLWSEFRGDELLSTDVKTPSAEFGGWAHMKPMVGQKHQHERKISSTNIIENSRILPVNHASISVENDGYESWKIQYDGQTGNAFPNLMIRSFEQMDPSLSPPTPGLIYKVRFDAKWTPDEGSSSPNMGLGIMDHRGYTKSGSAIAIRGIEGALEWTSFEANYQPLFDTRGIVILSRVEGGTVPVNGTLEIRNLTVEAWQSELFPERPLLSAYTTRSIEGDKLYMMVFNMSLDQPLSTQVSVDGFRIKNVTYTELNAESAVAINDEQSPVNWTAKDSKIKSNTNSFKHTFPAHSVTGILLESK